MAFICNMCGLNERECQCTRYCMICKSEDDVRLCEDGCFYCADCRAACDFTPET